MIKVSVIIPVYNVKKYLPECLDSVFHQCFEDFEVLCVDDASDDGSDDVLRLYAQKYSNLRLFLNKKRIGAAKSRNIGLKNAKGKYVVFLDSDDYFDLQLLRICYDRMEEKSLDVLLYDCARVDEDNNIIGIISAVKGKKKAHLDVFCYKDIMDEIPLGNIPVITWNRFLRRKFLLENRIEFQDLTSYNDNYFGFMTHLFAERLGVLQESTPLVFYRMQRAGKITYNREPLNFYHCIKKLKEELIVRKQWELYKDQVMKIFIRFLGNLKEQKGVAMCRNEKQMIFWEFFSKNVRNDFSKSDFRFPEQNFAYYLFEEYCKYNKLSKVWCVGQCSLQEMVFYGDKLEKFIKQNNDKTIAIWGLGNRGKALYLKLLHSNIFADYYVDKNVEKVDKDFFKEVMIQGTLQEPVDIIVATNQYIYNDLKNDEKYRNSDIVLLDCFL